MPALKGEHSMSRYLLLLPLVLSLSVNPAPAVDGFPPDVSRALEDRLARGPGLAVFDADWTIWAIDIGEEMHAFLAREERLPAAEPGKDPVIEYRALEKKDPLAAYTRCVLEMAGMKDSDAARWARAIFEAKVAPRVYPAQKNLIRRLQRERWDVWIVSASNRWAVHAGAKALGVAPDHVVSVEPKVEDGVIQNELLHPLPWGPGKVAAIRRVIGRQPDLVFGDSRGDRDMLTYSKGLAVLITYPGRASQLPLQELARRKGWLTPVLEQPGE